MKGDINMYGDEELDTVKEEPSKLQKIRNAIGRVPDAVRWVRAHLKPVVISLAVLVLVFACSNYNAAINARQEGYDSGYSEGYNAGYSEGGTAGYEIGYTSGKDDGYDEGYDKGVGSHDMVYNQGYNSGYNKGYAKGVEASKSIAEPEPEPETSETVETVSTSGTDTETESGTGSTTETEPLVEEEEEEIETEGRTVYITDSGKKYHNSSCRYLKGSKHAISEEEAKAEGYTACKVCGG